jgi:hypothetical protein
MKRLYAMIRKLNSNNKLLTIASVGTLLFAYILFQSRHSLLANSAEFGNGSFSLLSNAFNTNADFNFDEIAKSTFPTTDKVTHGYGLMYDLFLLKTKERQSRFKLLEIGVGCFQQNAGASVVLWKELYPRAELWFAEFADCVYENHMKKKLKGCNLLTGNQANATDVHRWIVESGGQFGVVVDDGGHSNNMIMTSFMQLWPEVLPGGLYFIEDLHVGRWDQFDDSNGERVVLDIIGTWIDDLVSLERRNSTHVEKEHNRRRAQFPTPADLKFVFCLQDACVLGKCKKEDKDIYRACSI